MFNFTKRSTDKLTNEQFSFLLDTPPDGEFICFDCDTTTFDPKSAELLTIGAVLVKENQVFTSQLLELHLKTHDTTEMTSTEHLLEPEEAISQFLHFIGSRPLIGYYAEFDVAMLNKHVKPLIGIDLPHELIDVSGLYYKKLQNKSPTQNIDLRFDTLINKLDLPNWGKRDAVNNSIMTGLMFIKLQHLQKI